MCRLFVNIFVINLIFIPALTAQNLLQYRLKIGDSITINQQATQDIAQDEAGKPHNIQNILEENYTFRVMAKTDSTYILNFKFNSFKLKTTSNKFGVLADIDTKKALVVEDTEGRVFSGLTAAVLEIEMAKSGKILRVSGTENMINSMISQAGIEDEFTKQLMIESMKSDFGSTSLSNSFEQLTHIYPENPKATTTSWTNTFTGDFNTVNTWAIDKITDAIFLNAKCTLSMNIQDEHTNLLLNGTQQIKVIANKANGFIKEMTVTAKAQSAKDLNNPERQPTIINSKTTYKIQ